MGIISQNLKYLRKRISLTQQQLADQLEVKRAVIGAYEEDRAEPKTELLIKIANLFSISVDEFISERISDKWFLKKEKLAEEQKSAIGNGMRVLSITVDQNNNENVELVPAKASAGYLNGYADPQYVAELPKFHLPFLRGGTFRAFELKGDSMLPLESGTIVVGEYIPNFNDVKTGETYVILSKDEGIVYKRVINKIKENKTLRLQSDNKSYETYSINAEDVLEIWKAKAYISTAFPSPVGEPSLEKLTEMVEQLQKSVTKLKSNDE
ncbi:XRE family transcriptional regulator [Solitalea koreensis]|uniref:DNA-binding transcriptional regulator, XRE-family HTH domain n=1 Tax=Solitalea koreensis TaxID=543615 RepID=A0A521BF87_9SPHI|nr:helix-turn-helix domain-containing protein [Solitalea koreensis]SMO45765.1 DNA-binding transcriptional regulator, XRE-family HTH domain [Solitalea koreensis]